MDDVLDLPEDMPTFEEKNCYNHHGEIGLSTLWT